LHPAFSNRNPLILGLLQITLGKLNRGKMTIYSHSRISTFEQCPLKYKFQYIDKLTPDIKQTIESFLGNMVHKTLQWIYNEVLQGRIPQLDEVIEFYITSWRADFGDEIKIVNQEYDVEYYFNKGIKFLIDYFLSNSPFQDNTIETEKKILIPLDSECKYIIQGYIDRLVHHKDTNIFEIHDYKTTSSMKAQEELDKDRQLALYSLGIRHMFQNVADVHLVWHFLAFNEKIISRRTPEQLKRLKQEIIELIKRIESTTKFKSNSGALCQWCEFQSHCPEINKK